MVKKENIIGKKILGGGMWRVKMSTIFKKRKAVVNVEEWYHSFVRGSTYACVFSTHDKQNFLTSPSF